MSRLHFAHRRRFCGRTSVSPQTVFEPGRVTLSGQNILDEFGNAWVPMGQTYGKNELYVAADPAEDVTMSADSVRIVMRSRNGDGNSPDGDPTGSGTWDPAYFTLVSDPVINAASAAGLKVFLDFDSNCDYNCHTTGSCAFGALPAPQHVWNNPTLRAAHLSLIAQAATRYLGKITFYGPAVEPAHSDTGTVDDDDIADFQEEVMNTILAIDPNALFTIGGRTYSGGKISVAYRATWATLYPNKIVLVRNLLGAALAGNMTYNMSTLVNARTTHNVPVLCISLGIVSDDDVTDTLTQQGFDLCRTNNIGVLYWEKVTPTIGGFGLWYLVSGTRTVKPLRYATVHGAFLAVG